VGIADDIERALATDHGARTRARQDVLLLFRELSWEDQHKVSKVIRGYFFHSDQVSKRLEEQDKRAECVEALKRAAAHLGLPEGEAPGIKEYEQARKELGLKLSAWTIERRWSSWPEVRKAVRGERVRMTARQRAEFGAAIRHRPTREEGLASVREWLASRPPSLRSADYDEWAKERNEQRPELRRAPRAKTVGHALGLSWRPVLKVARRELPLAEAHRRRLRTLRRESGGFASMDGVALILGLAPSLARYHIRTDPRFPAHAFMLHHVRVWHWEDVEAHHRGEPFPKRKPGEMQGEVVAIDHIMRLCGLTEKATYRAVRGRSGLVPRPAGRVSKYPYWLRSEVEAWSEQRGDGRHAA
jgi:predicted DNA-binding transcriptional regulator AlpA